MKVKHLIKALKTLDQEAHVTIAVQQSNKRCASAHLDIKYGYADQNPSDEKIDKIPDGDYNYTLNAWVNRNYQGASITVHLGEGVYIVNRNKEK